ncbi:MAG: prohibitin family protein [bacterium]|nr:prohibitin family protein [bacterium]
MNILILMALLGIFGNAGLILFGLYLLFKYQWPNIEQHFKEGRWKNIIDVDTGPPIGRASPPHPKVPQRPANTSFSLPHLSLMEILTPSRVIKSIIVIVIVLIFLDGFTSIPAGHVGVIYDRGRGVLTSHFDEGLHLKIPFWQVVEKFDTRLRVSTMSVEPGENERYTDDSIEGLTKDGQKVNIDATIQYRINGQDAHWIYQNIGVDFDEKVIRPGIRNVARDVITGYDSTNLFTQDTRVEAQVKMQEQLKELYGRNKIALEDVLLRNILFSDVYLQAIEDKQVAQQRIQKAEYERQEAEKAKEKKIIEAEAEAQAIKLKGETLRANPQVIQFEFVQRMADDIEWGILPNDILPLIDLKRFNQ